MSTTLRIPHALRDRHADQTRVRHSRYSSMVRSRLITVVVVLLVIAAIAAVVSLVAGPAAGGAVIAVLAVGAGVWIGADWRGDSATKTEEYRQELLGRPSANATYYDSDDDDREGQQSNKKDEL